MSDLSNFDLSKLIQLLASHKMFNEKMSVDNSPELMIIKMLHSNKSMDTEGIINHFDTTSFVKSIIEKLVKNNLIRYENEEISLNREYISSLMKEDDMDSLLPSSKKKVNRDRLLKDLTSGPSTGGTMEESLTPRERMMRDLAAKASPKEDDMDSLFDDLGEESLGDILGGINDVLSGSGIITPLIDLLRPYGYIDKTLREAEYDTVPAYQILNTILHKFPISTEEIEASIEIESSLSMLLSNLSADRLIDQTNDYRYTLSNRVFKKLKQYINSGDMQKTDEVDPDLSLINSYIKDELEQFKVALVKLGYMVSMETTIEKYKDKPEVEVLNAIRLHPNQPVDEIKKVAENTMPVVVMRMISKLKAENIITQDHNGNLNISPKLRFLMASKELKSNLDNDSYQALLKKYN